MAKKGRITLDRAGKIFVLAFIVAVFFMMLIPIYQIGQRHEYRIRIAAAEENIRQLDDEMRTLKSEISLARSPEALIDNVVEYSLQYDQIDPADTIRVARAGL